MPTFANWVSPVSNRDHVQIGFVVSTLTHLDFFNRLPTTFSQRG